MVVGRFGKETVTPEEILHDTDAVRLVRRRGLAQQAASLRAKGKWFVTINGSFDPRHRGHLYILNEAKEQVTS